MFRKKMSVDANNIVIEVAGTSASASFLQTWRSGNYSDTGKKIITLATEGNKLKIKSEVMVSSERTRNVSEKLEGRDEKEINRITTSLLPKRCKGVPQKYSTYFDRRELDREECPAPNGWRLFLVTGGEYSWLEIGKGESIWSTESEVVLEGDYRLGYFQSVHSSNVEWEIDGNHEPAALIFPVIAQDPGTLKNKIRFFVLRLGENPALCGAAKTLNEARRVNKEIETCKTSLSKRTVRELNSIK